MASRKPSRNWLFALAVISALLYFLEVAILGALEPGYSHTRQFASELGMVDAAHPGAFFLELPQCSKFLLHANPRDPDPGILGTHESCLLRFRNRVESGPLSANRCSTDVRLVGPHRILAGSQIARTGGRGSVSVGNRPCAVGWASHTSDRRAPDSRHFRSTLSS